MDSGCSCWKNWADKVFSHLPAAERVNALWDQIFKATRIYEKDPVLAWKEYDEKLMKKAEKLNQEQFTALHYTAPGTDIVIGLPKNHL